MESCKTTFVILRETLYFLQNSLPVFTLPMTLSTLVVLLTSQARGGQLARTPEMSYPERQARQHWAHRDQETGDQDWEEATAEEKEPTMKIDLP